MQRWLIAELKAARAEVDRLLECMRAIEFAAWVARHPGEDPNQDEEASDDG